ncbi:glycosyltransferase family 4 protein [Parvularcula sp. LCG005]|uniref:glycosyltransferase family 4 protein n=1 Tax=Parvularcula sp. LCG005 TaxID=3078805 RepID=UPI002943692D|nr:glycosyltransferase family 4 protein [Parvularcula sp. LCG005]WOI51986.1 glycosyltransferase family 4 protein [Parvularcula sp. LCG005]
MTPDPAIARRALHVFPTFAMGGAQRRFLQLVNGLPEWEHVVVALDGNQQAAEALPLQASVTLDEVALDKASVLSLRNLRTLRALFRRAEADLLCTYNWGSIEAALANRLTARLPHVHFEDGFGPEEAGGTIARRDQFRRFVLGGRSHIVVPSNGLAGIAADRWKIPASRLHLMRNGVDLQRFQPAAAPDRPVTIGSVGALRPEKNMGRLLRAVSAMETPAAVVLVGEGAERASLETLTADLNLNCHFTGNLPDPSGAYHEFDIFALTSDTEQMPLTVLEAMACALPIVATDVGDVADMVSEQNRPFIVPRHDEAALTDALSQLSSDASLRAALGAANRQRAEEVFGENVMVDAYRNLFARTVAQRV